MAQEVVELLDCVGAEKVVTVSHDWGSLLQSRLVTYHRERLLATAFLDIGYSAPPLSIGGTTAKALNAATMLAFGYPVFGYWFLFNEANASALLDAHVNTP
jgi:soluble epoxide hydrolase / lipid-phosphate phosphatase